MENKKIVLPTKEYQGAPSKDLNLTVKLDSDEVLLREGDMDISLDVLTLFDAERGQSNEYKIYGKLKMVFRNMYSGDTESYETLNKNLYLVGDGSNDNFTGYLPYNEFAFLRNDVVRELNVPATGSTLGTFTQNIVLTGDTSHTTITPINAPYQNWNFYLSYVDHVDTKYPMGFTTSGGTYYHFQSGDGIPFEVTSDLTHFHFTSRSPHNMKTGEYIRITGFTISGTPVNPNNLTGTTFLIDSVGNEVYHSEKYVINVLKGEFQNSTVIDNVVIGKRCVDIRDIEGTTSKYYVHKMKTVSDYTDYIMEQTGFESPIWMDEKKLLFQNSEGVYDYLVERNRMESVIFDFKEPFKLECITNNLGYTPNEIYVTVVFRNGNGYFDYPVKVGYKHNFHDTWIDKYFSGTTTLETGMTYSTFTRSGLTFKSGNTLPIGTVLTGAFVEYNKKDFAETVISEAYHKFYNEPHLFNYGQTGHSTTYNGFIFSGATADNPFGLFYQPFYRVMLRQISPYIETAMTNDVYNLPENAKYDEVSGKWKWRDIYDQGYIDPEGLGTNFPFINGTHYVHSDINFYLRNEASYNNKITGLTRFNDIKLKC